MRRIWGAIKVRCSYAEGGECQWTGNLGDALSHESRCARRLGSPRDLKIKQLDNELAKMEARLAEALAEGQEAMRRCGRVEDELKRRVYDFDTELKKREFDLRGRLEEANAVRADMEQQLAATNNRCAAFDLENRKLREANEQLGESHNRLIGEREEREAAASRHIKALQGQLSQITMDQKGLADDFGARSRDYETQLQNREAQLLALTERSRGLEMKMEQVANEAQQSRSELTAERNRLGAELDAVTRTSRQTEQQLYHVQRQLSESEERLHEEHEEKLEVAQRLERSSRDVDQWQRQTRDAEDALAKAERHFHSQLQLHSTEPRSHFDRSYKYDRYSVVKLAQLVSRDLEDRPSEISPNRVFSCIASCYEDLKRGWTDNPQNYPIDVRMLLSIAAASTWFNEHQMKLLDQWQREEGWTGHHLMNAQHHEPNQGGVSPALARQRNGNGPYA